MTYCFAWKYQDAVFLVADTLVTQGLPAPADRPATSTGEPHRQVGRNKFVQERQLKFRSIANGVAVAIAGDLHLGLAIVDFMQEHIGTVDAAADLLQMVEASFGPFRTDRVVELLVIQGMADGRTSITKWDTRGSRHEAAHCAHIGSMPPEQAERMADLFQRLVLDRTQSPSKRAMLLAGIAFVHSLSKHEDLIQEFVGGVVCGLRVQRGRTLWPGDVLVVHHRDGFASVDGQISLHARDELVYINSTYHGRIGTVFINKHASVDEGRLHKRWRKLWFPYLKDYLSKHFRDCVRWIFINLDQQTPLVFVVHGSLGQAAQHLRFKKKPDGSLDFTLDSELYEMLRRPAPSVGPDLRILEVVDPRKPLPDGMTRM